jgi:hypothetical protein
MQSEGKMEKTKIKNYLILYAAWAVDIALGFWIFILSRQAIQVGLVAFYLNGTLNQKLRGNFIIQASTLFIGLAWFAYILIIEQYMRSGIEKNQLYRRIAQTTGPMVLLIGAIDLFLSYAIGLALVGPLHWALIFLELAVGAVITWLGFRRKPAQPTA